MGRRNDTSGMELETVREEEANKSNELQNHEEEKMQLHCEEKENGAPAY